MRKLDGSAPKLLGIAIFAGVTEEISFRWLIFLSSIATVTFGNWLIFGFLGFGLTEHFNSWIFLPLAGCTKRGCRGCYAPFY